MSEIKYNKCPVCGVEVPLTLGKRTMHGSVGDVLGLCLGSEIGCLSPKNIDDLKREDKWPEAKE
jgi:hypothetical protein